MERDGSDVVERRSFSTNEIHSIASYTKINKEEEDGRGYEGEFYFARKYLTI